MGTMQSGRRTRNQQELSVLISSLSFKTSSQGQTKGIISAELADGLQDPYLNTLDISTSENLKLYNKEIVGLTESERYDLTRSKWTDFYQELEDAISIFWFKAAILIVTDRYALQIPTEFKEIILYYP